MENVQLQWKAHEYVHYEKGFGWYLTFWILAIMLVAYEIIAQDYFAALTIAIIVAVVYMFSRQRPREIDVIITDQNVYLDNYSVPFHNIKRFWIVHHEHAKALHFETNAYLNRSIVIQLHEQDPETIREALRPHLPETMPNEEHFSHRIARKLRF